MSKSNPPLDRQMTSTNAMDASLNVQTLSQAVYALWRSFKEAGIDTARLDARLLVIGATGVSREALLATPDLVLTEEQRSRIGRYHHQRLGREPVSRILGHRNFYGRTFKISPATLDPRADTETVIDCVLEYTRENNLQNKPLRVLDVGTGTGILVLTLLAELPNATGVGVDISPAALEIAKENAARLGLEERATFRCQDGLQGCTGTFDVFVSNPPYIVHDQIQELAPEVRDFDPHLALDGGEDGLSFYRAMAPDIVRVVPAGLAAFEIGSEQGVEVVEILKSHTLGHGTVQIDVKKDLAGHQRCVALQTLS